MYIVHDQKSAQVWGRHKQALRPLRFLHSFQDNVIDCSQKMVELDDRTRLRWGNPIYNDLSFRPTTASCSAAQSFDTFIR